jgi:hypothetical protein
MKQIILPVRQSDLPNSDCREWWSNFVWHISTESPVVDTEEYDTEKFTQVVEDKLKEYNATVGDQFWNRTSGDYIVFETEDDYVTFLLRFS